IRLDSSRSAADVSALGAGALSGTTLPIDPGVATAELGFSSQFANAMDAVADRDFVCDLAYATALCCVHLSRLAEEIVLWTSNEFGFARLDDEWSTGSSMMPQKRNPDIAELVRGRAAPSIGELTSLLTLLKGLPLAYDRDLQEDKGLIFATVARTSGCLQGMTSVLRTLTFDIDAMGRAARDGHSWATDLAERLVLRGVPFRAAHERVGALVGRLDAEGKRLGELTSEELAGYDEGFQASDLELADPSRSIEARTQPGGTAPERVLEQALQLRALIQSIDK
ncbi:MAG: argininosuccinate lyase, partial [Actinobacteria bacterium]|nr:argininosuccinate lyase [Actinomycetota bacterium]